MKEENLKPPFCRQGNKYNLRKNILPLIPPHKIYIELFTGSGAIFWSKPKAEINILNDLDENVINNFKLLFEAPLDQKKYKKDLNTVEKVRHFYSHHSNSIPDQLMIQKIKACSGFCNMPVNKAENIYKSYNPFSLIKNLNIYKNKLEGVRLTNEDYEYIVKKFDSPDSFFFVDPPYENTDKRFGYAESTNFDFERFAKVMKKIKGMFLITINDSPYIRELFKGFNIIQIKVYNNWASKPNYKKFRKELFITNY